jgi:hypothetical protein
MNHSLLVLLLAASVAAPTISDAAASGDADRPNYPQTMSPGIAGAQDAAWSASVKPGKSKKYKKKMNKQMKKRKRH